MGYLLLEGGAEFGGRMSEPDLRAIELAGGVDAPIAILPTAAAPDHNHKRAGNNGVRWFQSLGAQNVFAVDVIDAKSANDSSLASQIRNSKIIYLVGGFPRHLGETLKDSTCWDAALEAHRNGAVLAGSSAGAMVMCEHYFDPYEKRIMRGLNLVSNACVLPHHNNFGKAWAGQLTKALPGVTLIGIDEYTGMLQTDSVTNSRTETDYVWRVYGGGEVTLYRGESIVSYGRGGRLSL
ncbi:MAG: Type 1 glutamine amidotransferase-like domain-containing protein [Chloroflexi bacterium]|nr:Type 1 glutamine amidotransferase-like domain-containing protein [Chloroflexota bacterium]